MVGALEATGAIEEVADAAKDLTNGDRTAELWESPGSAAIGSGIVDNIPFTTAMVPVVESLNEGDDDAYWWALSLGACFGGNMTIIAAAANVAASGLAERAGRPIGFVPFLKIGLPVTLISLVMASAYILVRYVASRADAMPKALIEQIVIEVEPLPADEPIGSATRQGDRLRAAGPAGGGRGGEVRRHLRRARVHGGLLPRLHEGSRLGARRSAARSTRRSSAALGCVEEPIADYLTTDHVLVDDDYSDTQLAELFLHHRVLIIPIATDGRVHAVVTRSDFFRALARRASAIRSRTSASKRPGSSAQRRGDLAAARSPERIAPSM